MREIDPVIAEQAGAGAGTEVARQIRDQIGGEGAGWATKGAIMSMIGSFLNYARADDIARWLEEIAAYLRERDAAERPERLN